MDQSYLTRPTARDNIPVLDCPLDDHDGIVQAALHLRDELFGPASQHQRARLGRRTALEEIEALAANLPFFEALARAQVLRLDVGTGRGDAAAAGLHDPLEIVAGNASGAEDVAVGEVSGRIWSVGHGRGQMGRAGAKGRTGWLSHRLVVC